MAKKAYFEYGIKFAKWPKFTPASREKRFSKKGIEKRFSAAKWNHRRIRNQKKSRLSKEIFFFVKLFRTDQFYD